MQFYFKALAFVFLLLSWQASADEYPCPKYCTFVLLSEASNTLAIENAQRAAQAFSPYSSFKVASSVIGLDSGIIQSLQQPLTYDSNRYPKENWWPKTWHAGPLTIGEAFKYSAVPIYRQLATEVGKEKMQDYVTRLHYGNQDISSGLDNFWLNGSIKISAIEQVKFLQALFSNKLDVKPASVAQLKTIMLVEQTPEYRFYAKTGAGPLEKDHYIGWYVGMIERNNTRYYFATNVRASNFKDVIDKRIDFAKAQLRQRGLIE